MEDKQSDHMAGSQNLLNKSQQSDSVAKQATIELQDFFANIIPEPIDTTVKHDMDTDEVFSQLLASSISQSIDEYNDKLHSNPQINSSSKALQASSLIGRSVLVEDGHFYIEYGEFATGRLQIKSKAHHIFVYVENEQGDIVRIIPLGDDLIGDVSFTWNGITRTGSVAPEGEYRFIVSCISKGKVVELKAMTYNKIIRVTFDHTSDDVWLYFENDQTMNLANVVEILKE
ncbi:FlgD immunoglobulin-like domain containing protein [Thalassotalea nanhaiensis]|uniref:FlgD immunoglobulin-like domain containing protein n=1 Tax=Thalassotalea nanhaiensis TaxID=3065648 RepID=A0ABY9TMA1_9GAMM|nr:FlgD immunoglobulin-like domain containing protein [Colwelliaceae bacterium SQ345]